MHCKTMVPLITMILLAACSATVAGGPAAMDQSATEITSTNAEARQQAVMGHLVQPTSMAELAEQAAVHCSDSVTGDRCEAGDYDVELLVDCGRGGFFAGVASENGAVVVDKAPPEDSIQRATLSQGQIACIQAIARAGQNPAWYYVTALPVASIEACAGNPLCVTYGDRKVEWRVPHIGEACHSVGPGRYAGVCATGWVRASDLDVFSNGM
jgi:hypothetical protein